MAALHRSLSYLALSPLLPTHIPLLLRNSATLRWSLLSSVAWTLVIICFHCVAESAPKHSGADGLGKGSDDAITTASACLAWKIVGLALSWVTTLEGKGTEKIMASLVGVSSLLLAFRSNSALARWNAAASHWTGVRSTSNSLLRILAVHLPELEAEESSDDDQYEENSKRAGELHEETDLQSLLRLVPCFSLALFHQLEGRRLGLKRVQTRGHGQFLQFDETQTAEQTVRADYSSPQYLYALLPNTFAQRRWHRELRRSRRWTKLSSGTDHEIRLAHDEHDAVSLSQSAESKRETLLSQNVDEAQKLAEKAHIDQRHVHSTRIAGHKSRTTVLRPDNFAGEVLQDMQMLLARLNEGLPDLNDVTETHIDHSRDIVEYASSHSGSGGEREMKSQNRITGDGASGDAAVHQHRVEHRSSSLEEEQDGRRPSLPKAARPPLASVRGFESGNPKLATPLFAHCVGLLNSLSTHMAELEQLRDLPMPAILSSHLRLLLNLHILFHPLLIVPIFLPLRPCSSSSGAAPAVSWNAAVTLSLLMPPLCSGVLLTLHAIAEALAQPFGRGREKMPMVRWVVEVVQEWKELVE